MLERVTPKDLLSWMGALNTTGRMATAHTNLKRRFKLPRHLHTPLSSFVETVQRTVLKPVGMQVDL